MQDKKPKKLIIESLCELLITIKKMGIPFVILGSLFLIYSKIEGKPVVPFEKFMTIFLSMLLFQIILENVWLEKELNELREEIEKLKKRC